MKLKLLFTLLFCYTLQAQLIVNPNPFGVNSGTITITYGSTGNYSLFDPLSDPNLLLYTGLETDGNATTWDFHDDFANVSTMIPLTYNASLGYYTATLNIATHTYLKEPTLIPTTITAQDFVNNWYFLIRNVVGNRQSADLKGTDYGFVAAVLNVAKNEISSNEILITKNSISSFLPQTSIIELFNMLGQKITTFSISENETKELNLAENGIYFALITNDKKSGRIKFIN